MNTTCSKYQTSYLICADSWLSEFRLPAKTILKVLLHWSQGLIQRDILKVVEIDRGTLSKSRQIIISKIKIQFEENPIMLGGPSCIIHVDETMIYYKVKAHIGRSLQHQTWLLCIVDTAFSPARGFCCLRCNRTSNHLLPIISNVVRAGSTIYTDEFNRIIIYRHSKDTIIEWRVISMVLRILLPVFIHKTLNPAIIS
jgi:hypothetical protein